MNVTFLSVSAADLYSPYVGDAEKSIGELFHRARLGAPTILFIDEIGKPKF
jgi:transitional endoplasmic reticulum ATPase